MPVFYESNLEFDFDNTYWKAVLHEEQNTNFSKIKNTIQGTKSIDFIGHYHTNEWIFIEVTNYSSHQTGLAFKDGKDGGGMEKLSQEFMQKYKDTLASIVLAGLANSSSSIDWEKLLTDIVSNKKKFSVILWLEEDWSKLSAMGKKNRQNEYINHIFLGKLKGKFKKLVGSSNCVMVSNRNNSTLEGLIVK